MAQQRDDQVRPVGAGNSPFLKLLAVQNLLPYQGYQNSMFQVMVEGITLGDRSQGDRSDLLDQLSIVRLLLTVSVPIARLQTLNAVSN